LLSKITLVLAAQTDHSYSERFKHDTNLSGFQKHALGCS